MSSFNSSDPLIYMLRSGQVGDEYVPTSNSYKIINNKILLNELPVRLNRISIPNYFEISGDDGKAPASNEVVCDYTTGILTFNPSEEGKTVIVSSYSRGVVFFPSSRIWTKEQDGNVTQTLDSVVSAASNFVYKGEFSNSTVYSTYNMIRYQGSFYMYTSIASASGNLPTNASYFTKVAGNTNKGIYNASVGYTSGDIVENSLYQKVYQSLVDNNLNNPLSDTTKWQLLIDISNEVTSANTATTSATNATTAAQTATTNANNATIAANTAKSNADTATTNTNNATTAANTAAQNANNATSNANNVVSSVVHRGAYNASTSYVVNNSVSYNGSTYRCILNTTNNLPSDTTYWTVEALKGADGAGTVSGITSTNGDIAIGGTPQNPTLTLNSGTGANKIIKTDANGRAQVSDPSVTQDIVTKGYADKINGTSNADITQFKSVILNTDTRSTPITYDGSNRISTIQEKDGVTVIKTTTLAYNATSGLLETVTEVAGGVTVTTTLTYTNGVLSNTNKVVS